MLTADQADGTIVDASEAKSTQIHTCPDCKGRVCLRLGRIRIAHFSHRKRPKNCSFRGESIEHQQAKRMFRDNLRSCGHKADYEVAISSVADKRRADVLATVRGKSMVFEVQHSKNDLTAMERRSKSYAEAGLPFIWLVLLTPKMLNEADEPESWVRTLDYWPYPPWWKYNNALGYNKGLWFIDINGNIWRGVVDRCRLRSGWLSKHRVDLWLNGPFHVRELQIGIRYRQAYVTENMFLPQCTIVHLDVLPSKRSASG